MMIKFYFINISFFSPFTEFVSRALANKTSLPKMESKEELRKRLTPLQYQVTQEAGTESPFTGEEY